MSSETAMSFAGEERKAPSLLFKSTKPFLAPSAARQQADTNLDAAIASFLEPSIRIELGWPNTLPATAEKESKVAPLVKAAASLFQLIQPISMRIHSFGALRFGQEDGQDIFDRLDLGALLDLASDPRPATQAQREHCLAAIQKRLADPASMEIVHKRLLAIEAVRNKPALPLSISTTAAPASVQPQTPASAPVAEPALNNAPLWAFTLPARWDPAAHLAALQETVAKGQRESALRPGTKERRETQAFNGGASFDTPYGGPRR